MGLRSGLSSIVAASLLLVSSTAFAKLAVKGTPAVNFDATGPGGMVIAGKTADLTIADDGKIAVFTVPLKNLETGISLRDKHMKEKYLEVEKYPDATLKLDRGQITIPAKGKTSEGDAKGTFTCHGKSKDVTVHYKAHRESDGTIGAETKFPINLKDYDITIPNYLGVTVHPDINIQAKFQATDD